MTHKKYYKAISKFTTTDTNIYKQINTKEEQRLQSAKRNTNVAKITKIERGKDKSEERPITHEFQTREEQF